METLSGGLSPPALRTRNAGRAGTVSDEATIGFGRGGSSSVVRWSDGPRVTVALYVDCILNATKVMSLYMVEGKSGTINKHSEEIKKRTQ